MLSKAPTADVTVTIDAVNTRTTLDGFARFQEQVEVSLDNVTFFSAIDITFTTGNWNTARTVYVRAIDDAVLDGSDTQVFAPEAHTVNKIRGPLILEGAAGSGSLSLPAPLMLPGEINLRPSDGQVVGFQPAVPGGEGATEFMTIAKATLDTLIADPLRKFDSFDDFIGKTLELTEGPGTGVVLDSTRPRDLFDRFWLITAYSIEGSNVRLTLQNPTAVDTSAVAAPTAASKYAITNLSVNFFADERTQVDYVTVYDEDSVANDTGRLTSADGNVVGFTAGGPSDTMIVETQDLQAAAALLPPPPVASPDPLAAQLLNRRLEITVGQGIDSAWIITGIVDGIAPGTKQLTLQRVAGVAFNAPSDRSEYRIEGADRKGRITGFGMGPNVIIGNGVQPGGITYGDMEVMVVRLGSGDDNVTVNYTTFAGDHTTKRSGAFYTLTTLQTGDGVDTVTVKLDEGDDGAFELRTEAGDDVVKGGNSTAQLVVFGGDGGDKITTGSGADIVFGDTGRVDYLDEDGLIVTRLGHSIPENPVNPPVGYRVEPGSTSTTLKGAGADYAGLNLAGYLVQLVASDGKAELRTITSNTADSITVDSAFTNAPDASFFYRVLFKADNVLVDGQQRARLTDPLGRFELAYGGLVGFQLQVISPDGHVQFRRVISNTATELILDAPWTTLPVVNLAAPEQNFFYRLPAYPEDQSDSQFRGARLVWSINEAIGGNDTINAGGGADLVIGGAGGDVINGDAGDDWIAGDSARADFEPVTGNDGPTQLKSFVATALGTGGVDTLSGNAGADVLMGGAGGDTIYGDNLAGSANGTDLRDDILGDNGKVLLVAGRIASIETIDTTEGTGGVDIIAGNKGGDHILGGVGGDTISGNDGADVILGDQGILEYNLTAADGYDGDPLTLDRARTRDTSLGAGDTLNGNAGDDVILGGTGGDTVDAGADADLVFGDFGDVKFGSVSFTLLGVANTRSEYAVLASVTDNALGGADVLRGNTGEDVIAGGANSDRLDGGAEDDLIFGDNVALDRRALYLSDFTNRRFRQSTGVMYDLGANATMVNAPDQNIPVLTGTPAWGNWEINLLDHDAASTGGDDYIAGGAHDDQIFGQLGNDVIQGDGSIDIAVGNLASVGASAEAATDGDDYIEGNGGSDLVFGNLGQDDIIGGSSDLFSLTTAARRPDAGDVLFGGAGTDISRNDYGDADAECRGRRDHPRHQRAFA